MSDAKAKVIVVANQKGGVGKTTTVMNLARALTQAGKRVLVVDSDAQANLTSYLGITPERTLDELYLTKRAVDRSLVESFIHPSEHGVAVIAADGNLNGVEYYLFSRSDREQLLARALELVRESFDFILIDTPPSLNLLTLNALTAADSVLVPVQPEYFSLEGIVKIREAILDVRRRWNPRLEIEGILVTQANLRRKLTGEVMQMLRKEFENRVYSTVIRENSSVSESAGHATAVMDYAPASHGAQDYTQLCQEFLNREIQA